MRLRILVQQVLSTGSWGIPASQHQLTFAPAAAADLCAIISHVLPKPAETPPINIFLSTLMAALQTAGRLVMPGDHPGSLRKDTHAHSRTLHVYAYPSKRRPHALEGCQGCSSLAGTPLSCQSWAQRRKGSSTGLRFHQRQHDAALI